MKVHSRVYGRGNRVAQSESQLRESPSVALYLQRKAELETGRTRYEIHGDDLRYEKPGEDQIGELSDRIAELGSPSNRWRHELESGWSVGELEGRQP